MNAACPLNIQELHPPKALGCVLSEIGDGNMVTLVVNARSRSTSDPVRTTWHISKLLFLYWDIHSTIAPGIIGIKSMYFSYSDILQNEWWSTSFNGVRHVNFFPSQSVFSSVMCAIRIDPARNPKDSIITWKVSIKMISKSRDMGRNLINLRYTAKL